MKKVIAFFDFDGTLIKGDSLLNFLWYCTTPVIFIKQSFCLMPVLFKYVCRLMDSQRAKEQVYILFFSGVNRGEFLEKSLLFSLSVIPNLTRGVAIQRLKWHQENNHECILISASIEEYLLPWAESMGFSHILATRLEVDNNNNLTGKFIGKNCKGIEKVNRIKELLGDLKQYEFYAYGNDRGDKELLEIADHPFYKSFTEKKL